MNKEVREKLNENSDIIDFNQAVVMDNIFGAQHLVDNGGMCYALCLQWLNLKRKEKNNEKIIAVLKEAVQMQRANLAQHVYVTEGAKVKNKIIEINKLIKERKEILANLERIGIEHNKAPSLILSNELAKLQAEDRAIELNIAQINTELKDSKRGDITVRDIMITASFHMEVVHVEKIKRESFEDIQRIVNIINKYDCGILGLENQNDIIGHAIAFMKDGFFRTMIFFDPNIGVMINKWGVSISLLLTNILNLAHNKDLRVIKIYAMRHIVKVKV